MIICDLIVVFLWLRWRGSSTRMIVYSIFNVISIYNFCHLDNFRKEISSKKFWSSLYISVYYHFCSSGWSYNMNFASAFLMFTITTESNDTIISQCCRWHWLPENFCILKRNDIFWCTAIDGHAKCLSSADVWPLLKCLIQLYIWVALNRYCWILPLRFGGFLWLFYQVKNRTWYRHAVLI